MPQCISGRRDEDDKNTGEALSMPEKTLNTAKVFVIGSFFGIFVAIVLHGPFNGLGMHRRTRLAHVIAQRVLDDEVIANSDKSHWYRVDLDKITSSELKAKFIQLHDDEETKRFIEQSIEKSDRLFLQLWHNLATTFLSFFYTKTDILGMLHRGSMFVMSTEQIRTLAGSHFNFQRPKLSLIDLGAGDGCPTQSFAPFFDDILATEASTSMIKILSSKNIRVVDIDSWYTERQYDAISCLNLIDRCEEPIQLLDQIYKALKNDGIVFLALVLPFNPFVEFSKSKSHRPVEKMPIHGDTFEAQVESFAKFLETKGFSVVHWTRVPYLCEGDLSRSLYNLDDSVFVLKKTA